MEQWIVPALALAGVFLTVVGGVAGAVVTAGAAKFAAKTTAKAAEKSAENVFIDQLQEELSRYRTTADERATQQDARMQALEDRYATVTLERDILRDYAHTLRADIYAGKQPPPADWPVGVLR